MISQVINPSDKIEEQALFIEKQRFSQWWLWLILLGIDAMIIFGFIQQVIFGQPFGDNPASDTGLMLILGLVILLTIAFYLFCLETIIKPDGIYVRFYPFHTTYKYYSWEKISKIYIRQYSPIKEYGGWGVRLGLFGKGKAYNVSGNKGLQIVFSDNSKLLI